MKLLNKNMRQLKLNNQLANLIALSLLCLMGLIAFFSMRGDALTFDELAHLGAGYSYLVKQDYRLNPEHPPLSKDIAALPLLLLNLNFPNDSPTWLQKESAPAWWVQFDFGRELIYRSGNNPRQIILWARSAMIVFLLLLGWFLFFWTKKISNHWTALGVLLIFTFCPTFLAHGRLTNTDVGAAFGALIAISTWLSFLKQPNIKRIILAGLGFGLAMIAKFSLILLIPFFVIITLFYVIINFAKQKLVINLINYLAKSLLIGLIGLIFVIWPVYQFHIWHYPHQQQIRDTIADVSHHPIPWAKDIGLWLTSHQFFRALGQYCRGLLMASQRTSWGNTAVFMGEIAANSWLEYFPILYLTKIPLAFHLLTVIVFIGALKGLIFLIKKHQFVNWLKNNFIIISCLLWIIVYWTGALLGNLNIGIRHLLPVFPFIYVVVIWGINQLMTVFPSSKLKNIFAVSLSLIFIWYIISSLSAFPHYLSYYNELAGGIKNGYKIAVDSNYDWGQDFYRLLEFMKKNQIEKIYLDYFGGEDLDYWLKDRYVILQPKKIKEPPKGWLAVSVNQLQGGLAKPVRGFDQPTGYYQWLENYQPIARAGYSIFIYYLD